MQNSASPSFSLLFLPFNNPRNLPIHPVQEIPERHVWVRVFQFLLIINRVEVVHHGPEPVVFDDWRLSASSRRQHFDDVDSKAFVMVFAPSQVVADGQAFHIQRRASTFRRFDHIAGRVPHEQPHLYRWVVVAVLLAIQILLHEVLVRHPFRSDVVREIGQDASFALLGVESDGDDDGFCGHIFAVFDAAKITQDCADSWHCGAPQTYGLPAQIARRLWESTFPPAATPR